MEAYAPARWILACALGACSLTGCTSPKDYVANGFKVGPNYGKPPAPIASDWIDAADKRVRQEADDHRQWWKVFQDPVLDSLICAAYQQNLTLRQAGWRIMQARASLNIARGNLFAQTQNASGSFSHNQLSQLAANQGFLPEKVFDNWGVGFNLNWELDFWGRFRRSIESARGTLDASIEDYDDALVTLLSDVASDYVRYRVLEKEILLVKQNVSELEATLVRASAGAGKIKTALDANQVQSILSQAEALIPQLEAQSRNTTNALCILLSIPAEDLRAKLGPPPRDRSIPTAPPSVAVGIPAELLTRRPDVRRAERQAAAQSAQIGVAEANLYPHIAIVGTIGWQSERFVDLFKGDALTGTIGPAFQWNILNYGRLLNNIRLQDARFQELVAAYQNTVIQASAEVENGLVNFLQAQQQERKLQKSVEAAVAAVKLIDAQFRGGGAVDFNQVAVIQQNKVAQENLLAQAQGDIALGLIQTFRALGGGWQIRLDGCNESLVSPAPAPGPGPMLPAARADGPPPPTLIRLDFGGDEQTGESR